MISSNNRDDLICCIGALRGRLEKVWFMWGRDQGWEVLYGLSV